MTDLGILKVAKWLALTAIGAAFLSLLVDEALDGSELAGAFLGLVVVLALMVWGDYAMRR